MNEFNPNTWTRKGDLCWMLVCTILCWQITPAIGFLVCLETQPHLRAKTNIYSMQECIDEKQPLP